MTIYAFDAAPWAHSFQQGVELVWDDPREIHRVIVEFERDVPADLSLEYWRHRWPQKRLPKDHLLTGGSIGWWELGNWFAGEYQAADAEIAIRGTEANISFRPVNEREFPDLDDFMGDFRTTFKIRLVSQDTLPSIRSIHVYTDSVFEEAWITVLWEGIPGMDPLFEAFNGYVEKVETGKDLRKRFVKLRRTRNTDPNTFDKTLLTLRSDSTVTVLLEDLLAGPVLISHLGICVAEGRETRGFEDCLQEVLAGPKRMTFEQVGTRPEQTWQRAWNHMVPKRQPICLPLGTDGGRHKFQLNADGSVNYRTNNLYLERCPGRDTARLEQDVSELEISFGLPPVPSFRTLKEEVLPVGITSWTFQGLEVKQTAFVTVLDGIEAGKGVPEGDAHGILLCRMDLANRSETAIPLQLPVRVKSHGELENVSVDERGILRTGDKVRAILERGRFRKKECGGLLCRDSENVFWKVEIEPGGSASLIVKIPYLWPEEEEMELFQKLDFDGEMEKVSSYWRRRLAEGMKLHTPESMLNEFHRAHAGHLLINCEREPGSTRRFARVGSFRYGVYGDESCMMIMDLDRRGYHREARECLEAFLYYQGTVALPGNYVSQEGVLYGAAGYECGGYNKHHGWTLWCLVEHFRFTRDTTWLRKIVPNLLAASDWILRERACTLEEDHVGLGLLPHGSLEDIADWWQWLVTNVYAWKGLVESGWALGEIGCPEAKRILEAAREYREDILRVFTRARENSPVVRLGDGVYVPHFPSHPQRRGRSFGWICETLEGAIHLLITGILDPSSREGTWILRDYEENLFLSPEFGYETEDFVENWFDWGGFSMQATLLLHVEPYLDRDEPKHALRGIFNAIAAGYFPDTRMCCEHALPKLGDWRGDHYKSSDEANATGWLRKIFVREQGDTLFLGQAVPRDWLRPGMPVGVERAATHFGPMDLMMEADDTGITADLRLPRRNPASRILLRFGLAQEDLTEVWVNGEPWTDWDAHWIRLPAGLSDGDSVLVRGVSP